MLGTQLVIGHFLVQFVAIAVVNALARAFSSDHCASVHSLMQTQIEDFYWTPKKGPLVMVV